MAQEAHPYVLFTDVTADLPPEIYQKYGIHVLPMTYTCGGKDYVFDGTWSNDKIHAFYEGIRGGDQVSTSQISPVTYEEYFSPFLSEGKDILYVCFSSGLSGTYQSSILACDMLMGKFPGRKVISIDSLGATFGEGLAVLHAAENRENGLSIEENARIVKERILKNVHWFTVDDLMFLKRGGRISAATAILGTTLQIKPVMHVDNEGHLIPVDKAQGRRTSLKALAKRMKETGIDLQNQVVYVGHGDDPKDAAFLAEFIKKTVPVRDVHIGPISPIIGAHSGPGTIALFFVGTVR